MARIVSNSKTDLDAIVAHEGTEVVYVERSHLTRVQAGDVLDVECGDGRHVLVSLARLDVSTAAPAAPAGETAPAA